MNSPLRRLVLVRHGETDGNSGQRLIGSGDPSLSAEGREQLHSTRAALAGQVVDLVVSSPARRAFQSAAVLTGGATTRLEPDFREGRFYLAAVTPQETKRQAEMRAKGQGFRVFTPTRRRDENGNLYSLNKNFIEEFLVFPFGAHDDLIDASSRIFDIDAAPPIIVDESELEPPAFGD